MYKFPLESVLKCRENVEKKHAQDMASLKTDLREADRKLSESVSLTRGFVEKLEEEEKRGVTPQEVLLYKSFIKKSNLAISEQKRLIESLNELIEKKRQELNAASVEKKVVVKLKEKDRKKYFQEMTKRHRKEMDDIAVMRHTRG